MINTISDKSLQKHTGKIWSEWLTILEKAGAKNWSHQETVAFLKKKNRQSQWWQQMITNGFQVATGLRVVGQSLKGTYSGTMTKTIPISAKKLWDFCISEKGLEIWLKPMSPVEITKGESFEVDGGIFGEIRTVKKGSRIRLSWTEIDWDKITTVQLSIFKKPKGKSMLVFQHEGLRTAQQKVQMRTYWRKAIEEMARQVPHA